MTFSKRLGSQDSLELTNLARVSSHFRVARIAVHGILKNSQSKTVACANGLKNANFGDGKSTLRLKLAAVRCFPERIAAQGKC